MIQLSSAPPAGPARARWGIRAIHRMAGVAAFVIILTFWTTTVLVELVGSEASIAAAKQAIAWGLLVLAPALALTGASGFRLAGASTSPLVRRKRQRMPFIVGNGALILAPSAIALAVLSARGESGRTFVLVQAVELAAGLANLVLIGLNIRDGLRTARRS